MKLNVRNLVESDYDLLVQWWKDWGWDPVPQDMLPDNGVGGVMVQQGGKPIIAGFLFVEGMVKSAGKKYIITISDNKSFISTLKKKSWYVDDEPIKKIIKKI